jgi:hypothetical protein
MPGNRNSQPQEKQREKTPGSSQISVICFMCNKGHYANSCPEKKSIQGYALEIVEENNQEEVQEPQPGLMEPGDSPAETELEGQETSPEGKQYDLEDYQERF